MEFRSGRYPFSFEWSNRWGRSFSLTLGPKTVIMGALNLTPDSFFDGGFYPTVDEAVNRALAMEEAGAGIIDLGGESTRPGAVSVPEEEELQRIMPVLERVVERLTIHQSFQARHDSL